MHNSTPRPINYYTSKDGWDYSVQLNEKGFSYGAGQNNVATMSAAGGGGGSATFTEFLDGKYNDFVLEHFGQGVLNEMRAHCWKWIGGNRG